MVEPEVVASMIQSRARDRQTLRVFWVTVAGDRDEFAGELRRLTEGNTVVPVVLRTGRFVNSDAVMRDVADILDGVRAEIESMTDATSRGQHGVDLVVLSRRELSLADTSSPIVLPDWFPIAAGQRVTVGIVDLTWSAEVPLSDKSCAVPDLRRILHDLDKGLVARLQDTVKSDHRRTQALWDLTRSDGRQDGGMADELARMKDELDAVRQPKDYRPSASKKATVVGRLWAHGNRTSPDALPRTAGALTKALDLGEVPADDVSLVAVLGRPTNVIRDRSVVWSLCLIVTLRSACQLVTAAAHSDEYPPFPAVLLKSTSLDIRRFLDAAVTKLQSASGRDN